VEIALGELTDPAALRTACTGVDSIFHVAARVASGDRPRSSDA
jgi:uncharacterized protein YbjT (DUF2867 family)